jgi:hypothetical protein
MSDRKVRYIDWFNRSAPDGAAPLPAMTRAGIAHLYLVRIHPFEDGNGRIGRVIAEKVASRRIGHYAFLSIWWLLWGVWLGIVWLAAGQDRALAQPLSNAEMLDYLAQSICLDAAGNPSDQLPIEPNCMHHRLQTSQDMAHYRKHDWPDRSDPRLPVDGYQASDSVIEDRGHRMLVVQTFDFGDTRRVFGKFDTGQGDGGQVVVVADGWASIAMTEDGGDGVQWFVADGCRSNPKSDQRYLGWLMFRNDATSDRWRDIVTYLNKERAPGDCPWFFAPAYTRYRSGSVEFPFRIVDTNGDVTAENHRLDVIISEHYGGRSIALARHLERFYLAKGLGMVRWERWENPARSDQRGIDQAATGFARSGRCPSLDMHETADRDWKLVDCRMWTNLVRAHGSWSVDDYRWRALDQFGTPAGGETHR